MADADDPYVPLGPSKALVKSRDTGDSLSARISAQIARLTWRTPLHRMRLKGRYPLKLLAVPDDPIAGDADLGAPLFEGRLAWLGEETVFANSFAPDGKSTPFADRIQRFEWLRDLAAAGPRSAGAPVAEALTRMWIAQHGEKVSDTAWRPDLWGWRILFWAAHAPLILSSTDLVYRSSVLNCLARGARHLDRTADRAPQGLPRIAAWAGVTAAGLLISGTEPRRSFGEAGLSKALASGMTVDGGLICRSPANQADTVQLLAMLAKIYDARRIEMPTPIRESLASLVPPLLGVRMGDGGIGGWQGSRPLTNRQISDIIAASAVRTRPLAQARDWGYQRMAGAETVLVCDAAPPPLGRVAGRGCASTLGFELSDGDQRLIVNCGGANGGGARVVGGLADGLRTTAAHSTLILSDSNSTAVLADGALGKGVTEVELDREDGEDKSRIEVRHDGYRRRFGFDHRRTLILTRDGREVHGEDQLLPAGNRKQSMVAGFALRFHLAPGVEATPTADGQAALLRIDKGPLWQFRCRGGAVSIDDSIWVDADGVPQNSRQIVVQAEAPPGGASISWLLKRAG
jgi:uncharacterized heparinase superfamily protein